MQEQESIKSVKSAIEWANHLIAFVSSVLGILIGLSLDQSIQKSAEAEHRESFLRIVDDELNRNAAELDSVAAAAEDLSQLFFFLSDRFEGHFDMGGENAGSLISRYRVSAREYDSLKNRFRKLIPYYERFVNGYWETGFTVEDLSITLVNTAWHAFNNSESIRGFDIDRIIQYSRAYEQLDQLKTTYNPDEDSTKLIKYVFGNRADSGKDRLKQIGQIYSKFVNQADKTLETIYRIRNKPYKPKAAMRVKAFGISMVIQPARGVHPGGLNNYLSCCDA